LENQTGGSAMVKQFIRVMSDSFRNKEKQEHENNERSSPPAIEVIPSEPSQESEPQSNPPVTIDASTGEIIEADTPSDEKSRSSLALKQEEIALNAAFYKGILALQSLNLDKDLYWQALDDLRKKYYRARSQDLESNQIV
jgi:hypothetical protein